MAPTLARVAILALPRHYDTTLAMSLDVLRAADALGAQTSLMATLYTFDGGPVETACGFRAPSSGCFEQGARSCDLLLVPGFGVAQPEAIAHLLDGQPAIAAAQAVAAAYGRGVEVAASCSAVFVLAQAGVLDGQEATTTWWLAQAFRARFPRVTLRPQRALVAGERTLCAGAAMAHADLMLAIVARLAGPDLARTTARHLLIAKRAYQPQHLLSSLEAARYPDVARAADWVREHLASSFTIEDLARDLGLSARTLSRRLHAGIGLSPLAFVRHLRAQQAIHLLETTTMNFEAICAEVGYANTSSLRRLLKTQTGCTPQQLRAASS